VQLVHYETEILTEPSAAARHRLAESILDAGVLRFRAPEFMGSASADWALRWMPDWPPLRPPLPCFS